MNDKKVESKVGSAEIDNETVELRAKIPADWISDDPAAIRVRTGLTLGRSVDYGDHSYRVTMGLDIPVEREKALSGEAHLEAYDFIERLAIEAVIGVEDGWIPEGLESHSPVLLEPNKEEK